MEAGALVKVIVTVLVPVLIYEYTNCVPSKPVPVTSNNTTVCQGMSANLFVTGGVSYVWSPQSTLNFPYIPLLRFEYYIITFDTQLYHRQRNREGTDEDIAGKRERGPRVVPFLQFLLD